MTRHREILDEASRLAELLQSVKPSAFSSLVASFDGDVDRLHRLLALAADGEGGHRARGEGYGDQVAIIGEALPPFLRDTTVAPDLLPSVFGWTSRLLRVREAEARRPQAPLGPRAERTVRRSPSVPAPKDERRRNQGSARNAPAGGLKSGLSGSNLAELSKLLRRDD